MKSFGLSPIAPRALSKDYPFPRVAHPQIGAFNQLECIVMNSHLKLGTPSLSAEMGALTSRLSLVIPGGDPVSVRHRQHITIQ